MSGAGIPDAFGGLDVPAGAVACVVAFLKVDAHGRMSVLRQVAVGEPQGDHEREALYLAANLLNVAALLAAKLRLNGWAERRIPPEAGAGGDSGEGSPL